MFGAAYTLFQRGVIEISSGCAAIHDAQRATKKLTILKKANMSDITHRTSQDNRETRRQCQEKRKTDVKRKKQTDNKK
jgi:hypothetical protein